MRFVMSNPKESGSSGPGGFFATLLLPTWGTYCDEIASFFIIFLRYTRLMKACVPDHGATVSISAQYPTPTWLLMVTEAEDEVLGQ